MVGAAAGAGAQMDGGAGEPFGRVAAGEFDLDVLIEDRDSGVTTRIGRIGAQEIIERLGYAIASAGVRGCPAAARLERRRRRASKRFL